MVVEQICPVCADGSTNLHVIKFHRTMCLVTQSYPTLCDPRDCSPPGSSVHGGFPGNNNWNGLSSPPPGDLSNPGIEPRSPTLQADSLWSEPPENPLTHMSACKYW